MASVRGLARNRKSMSVALKLGPTQMFEVERNRTLRESALRPAIERYTGVLFDALDSESLGSQSREFGARTVIIHSALFGLLGANDPIPAYRLSHDSKLPGLSLGGVWRGPISRELAELPGLILDLRSEAYVKLGPAPSRAWFVRVVTEDADGSHRALNHFNKRGKGEFTRAILDAAIDHDTIESLLGWAATSSIRLRRGSNQELFLLV